MKIIILSISIFTKLCVLFSESSYNIYPGNNFEEKNYIKPNNEACFYNIVDENEALEFSYDSDTFDFDDNVNDEFASDGNYKSLQLSCQISRYP